MLSKYTILIVDDLKENIDVLNGILNRDYKIRVALNGETALMLAEKYKPDLILLDVMMPGIDGYEVCRKLKGSNITKNIPVMFVSALDEDVDEARGFEVGAVDYILKPISPIVVKSRVKTHLLLSDSKKELERKVIERTNQLEDTRYEIIKIIGRASEYRDNETGLHVIRVGEYSYTIAKTLGFSEYDANLLRSASQMHDVGKIGIPDNILSKPGKLNNHEWKIMMTHSEIGYDIFGKQDSDLLKMARNVAFEHHEKFDGSGYPRKLKGSEICIEARIVAICDVFDALINERPYKKAWTIKDALKLIESEKGKHFDNRVVDAFFKEIDNILEIYNTYKE